MVFFLNKKKTMGWQIQKPVLEAPYFTLHLEALSSPPLPLLGDILNKHLRLLQQGPNLQKGVLTSPPQPLVGTILTKHLLLLHQGTNLLQGAGGPNVSSYAPGGWYPQQPSPPPPPGAHPPAGGP